MKNYNTKQRSLLVEYFENKKDELISADELIAYFCKKNLISESSIYRNLVKLTADGVLECEHIARKSYYRLNTKRHCDGHLHLKCKRCGRLVHLDDTSSSDMISTIRATTGFDIDMRTAEIQGVCEGCKKL